MYENKNINLRMIEMYSGRLLAEALVRKLLRKIGRRLGFHPMYERGVSYNGVIVFDSADLHGEGTTVGQDYMRALLELGFKRCERIFEFCAGPGYIGYSLLAHGFCEKLTLADVNPAAVEMARRTAIFNKIEHLVNIYQSDCLDQIPLSERCDLVVGNPPHFLPRDRQHRNIKVYDPEWSLHRRFYDGVKKFMSPGGFVVMMENSKGSNVDIFKPMIEQRGGKFLTWRPGIDVCGKSNDMYYVVSQW